MFYIPIQTAYPDQTLRIELDGIAYDMRVYYSAYDDLISDIMDDGRSGKWYLEIVGANGVVSEKNIALVNGADLLDPYGYEQLGSLFVVDGENLGEIPDFDNMGSRYKILYIPKAEQDEFLITIGYEDATI